MSKQARQVVRQKKPPKANSIYLIEPKESTSVVTRGCLHPVLGLPALTDDSIDHSIMDPPFEKRTHEKRRSGVSKKRGISKKKKMSFDKMDSAQREIVAREIVRVTRGWALIFCEDTAIKLWQDSLKSAGAKIWVTCIWEKPNASPQFTGMGPAQPCEHFITAWCGRKKQKWNGGGKVGRYTYNSDKSNKRHDAQKPLALMEQLILDFTMPGELLADPYFGSGRTLVAAKKLGRLYIGWEIDKRSFEVAKVALSKTFEQTILGQRVNHRARAEAFGVQRKKYKQTKLFK